MSPSKDGPMDPSGASIPKIAVKGFSLNSKPGNKPVSFITKATSKHSPSSILGKRPRAALHDGSEDEGESIVQHEAVTGFDIREGGALKKIEAVANGPLVIPRIKNRDWREEIRQNRQRGKNLLPPEVQAQRRGEGGSSTTNGDDIMNGGVNVQWGLTITKKVGTTEQNGDGVVYDRQDNPEVEVETTSEVLVERPPEKTADELAIEALIGTQSAKKEPDLIIPRAANSDTEYTHRITEEDAYRRAVRSAPEVSTLEDYERVPVEEFGAALLRGMGWKEGDEKRGTVVRPKDVKRRQNLLGLGATELRGVEELGAWVQKSDPKRLVTGSPRRDGERRPRANEYREREERKREMRDERYGGSHRRDKDDYRDRDRDRNRDRDRRR
jgi:hypothetical protein